MTKLNRDVLYLILKEFHNNKEALYSCLLVNKTWYEIIIPILWKNPWKFYLNYLDKQYLLNAIISHLSNESKNNLYSQGINFSTNIHKRPLIKYISFCRHLNLGKIKEMIMKSVMESAIIMNEIFYLFVNENTKFTHLYINEHFDYKIHLIPGAEICFSLVVMQT
jgi:hypothetical protein